MWQLGFLYGCYTLFSKRNASFWKMHFFWERLYAIWPGIIHHFQNALGDKLPKTPFQNCSWFSYNLKVFQYMSPKKNHETELLQEVGRLYFFFGRVYFSEPAAIHHFCNGPGNNLQKTAFQNSSRFSPNRKVFRYTQSWKNQNTGFLLWVSLTWSRKFYYNFQIIWYFWVGVFANC